MTPAHTDTAFSGSIPECYERDLVPLIFEPYATDIAARAARLSPTSVLEVAAGTGVVTRALADALPASASIVATDLNQPMLDHAVTVGTSRPVTWRQADAMALPFPDGAFDVVVCQFGVMFFPDRARAFSEARRVLRAGGTFLFNAWDRIERNDFADVVTRALADLFPDDPPRFLARVPHGYHDRSTILADLAAGGFDRKPVITPVHERSRADSPTIPARAFCLGTPLRSEIESRDAARLDESVRVAAAAIERAFGPGPVIGAMQANVVGVER